MEAIWKLEDKWKLSTKEAILLLVCTALLVVGLCMATAFKKVKRNQLVNQEPNLGEPVSTKWREPSCNWGSIKSMLMGSVRWSRGSKWEEERSRPAPLLVGARGCEGDIGWQSHNSDSPVWQRPILMGEKCELPRFSGLILYDERGQPLQHASEATACQDKTASVVRTTLRDLL